MPFPCSTLWGSFSRCSESHFNLSSAFALIVIISLKVCFSYDALHLICKHINAHIDDDDDDDNEHKTEEKIVWIRFTVENPQKEKNMFSIKKKTFVIVWNWGTAFYSAQPQTLHADKSERKRRKKRVENP